MVKNIKTTNYAQVMLMNSRGLLDHLMNLSLSPAKLLEQTEFRQAFIVNGNSIGYGFQDDDRPERLVKGFFATVSEFMSKAKVAKVDEPIALLLSDVTNNFKFAAIVKYCENKENPEESGNWEYSWTFNEDDVIDLEKNYPKFKKLLCSSTEFISRYDKVARDVAGIQFEHSTFIFDACMLVVDTILQILDREAVETDQVDVEMPGYFIATVAVEDGEKVFAITPDGLQKEILKGKDGDRKLSK